MLSAPAVAAESLASDSTDNAGSTPGTRRTPTRALRATATRTLQRPLALLPRCLRRRPRSSSALWALSRLCTAPERSRACGPSCGWVMWKSCGHTDDKTAEEGLRCRSAWSTTSLRLAWARSVTVFRRTPLGAYVTGCADSHGTPKSQILVAISGDREAVHAAWSRPWPAAEESRSAPSSTFVAAAALGPPPPFTSKCSPGGV